VIYSPTAKWFAATYGQITVQNIGKVNASKPMAIGEFEFQDPRDLVDHMLVPRRIERIVTLVEKLLHNNQIPEEAKSVTIFSRYTSRMSSSYGSIVPITAL
jgi:hypothetical protein